MQLIKFIEKNKLDLETTDSSLNSVCCILAGYSLYLDLNEEEAIEQLETHPHYSESLESEFLKVYEYAWYNSYGEWWKRKKAKKMYKF